MDSGNAYSSLSSSVVCDNKHAIRKETLHGREYLVAHIRLLVPGVLNGSQGPLLYPIEEVSNDAQAWNGMPIVLGHPEIVIDGISQHISARSPSVLSEKLMGYLFNVEVSPPSSTGQPRARGEGGDSSVARGLGEDTIYPGALEGEAWFDVQATRTISPSTLSALQKGNPIEVSTGLFLDQEKALPDATYNGTPYDHVARNYRPDHLAILGIDGSGEKGACSNDDGCGINVNTTVSATTEVESATNCGGPGGTRGPCAKGDKAPPASGKGSKAAAVKSSGPPKIKDVMKATPKSKESSTQKKVGEARSKQAESEKAMGSELKNLSDVDKELSDYGGSIQNPGAGLKSGSYGTQAKAKIKELVKKREGISKKVEKHSKDVEKHKGKAESLEKQSTGNKYAQLQVLSNTSHNGVSPMSTNTFSRPSTIHWLTTNCRCWNGRRATLSKMSDLQLRSLRTNAQAAVKLAKGGKSLTLILNALKTSNQDEGEGPSKIDTAGLAKFFGVDVDPAQDPSGFITALIGQLDMVREQLSPAPPPPPGSEPAIAQDEEMEEEPTSKEEVPEEEMVAAQEEEEMLEEEGATNFGGEDENDEKVQEEMKKKKVPITLQGNSRRQMTEGEWMATAPPRIKAAMQLGIEADKRERVTLVNKLTANLYNPDLKKARRQWLLKKPTEELRIMASLIPTSNNSFDSHNENVGGWDGVFVNSQDDYSGAGGFGEVSSTTNKDDELVLCPPTFNDLYQGRQERQEHNRR